MEERQKGQWLQLRQMATDMVGEATRQSAARHMLAALATALMHTAVDISNSSQTSEPMQWRMELQEEALQAHQALHHLAGKRSHSLGQATTNARHLLSWQEKRTLQKLRRRANEARHSWEEPQQMTPNQSIVEVHITTGRRNRWTVRSQSKKPKQAEGTERETATTNATNDQSTQTEQCDIGPTKEPAGMQAAAPHARSCWVENQPKLA